jgi:hypothetical protein
LHDWAASSGGCRHSTWSLNALGVVWGVFGTCPMDGKVGQALWTAAPNPPHLCCAHHQRYDVPRLAPAHQHSPHGCVCLCQGCRMSANCPQQPQPKTVQAGQQSDLGCQVMCILQICPSQQCSTPTLALTPTGLQPGWKLHSRDTRDHHC